MRRLFFALWPTPAEAERIAEAAAALDPGGRPVAAARLHLTLAFHGNCDATTQARLTGRADAVNLAPFTFDLDRLGCFRRARIAWLGPSETPTSLLQLAQALAPAQTAVDQARFTPHVTIARHCPPLRPQALSPIPIAVTSFALVASGDDASPGIYRTLARWRLAGADPAAPGME